MIKMKKLEFCWQEQNELAHPYKTKDSREFWKSVSSKKMTAPKSITQEEEWFPFFEKLEAGTASGTQQPPPDFEKLSEEFETPSCDHNEYHLLEEDYHLCRQIQREEIEDAIKQNRGGSAPGTGGIPAKILNVQQVVLFCFWGCIT